MPKVERGPRSRDVAAAGGDARAASSAEPPHVKTPVSQTLGDDIPPVHVLEAAQNQERKETEDLLAGFDRPGRGPKKPSAERDFVDYYVKKKGGPDSGRGPSPASASAAAPAPAPRQAEVATVVKPRKTRGLPPWMAWAGPGLAMLALGGVVAYFAMGDGRSSGGTRTGPGAATTITAATTPLQVVDRDVFPPPAPADPTTTTALTVTAPPLTAPSVSEPPPRPTGRRDPRGIPSAGSAATGATSNASTTAPSAERAPPPPHREDFIRDL